MTTQVLVFSKLDIMLNGGIEAISHKSGEVLSVMAGGRNHLIWTLHPSDQRHAKKLLIEYFEREASHETRNTD